MGYDTYNSEKAIQKWSGKKRDHVDEILLRECQEEASEWTNYDVDELIVKNGLTNDIMNMLLIETGHVLQTALDKRAHVC